MSKFLHLCECYGICCGGYWGEGAKSDEGEVGEIMWQWIIMKMPFWVACYYRFTPNRDLLLKKFLLAAL